MKNFALVSVLISVAGLSSAIAASSTEHGPGFANCPDDYYGDYAISGIDYVAITTSETRQMYIEFGGSAYQQTVIAYPSTAIGLCRSNPDGDINLPQISCSISCESNGVLNLKINGIQHIFSKNGTALVVDGKTYPMVSE